MELYNDEYELTLLGILISKPDLIDQGISEEIFFRDRSKIIYRAIRDVYSVESTVDLVRVVKAAGPKYAADIAEASGKMGSFDFYSKELRELYNKRKLMDLSKDCIASINDISKSSEEIIGGVETGLLQMEFMQQAGYSEVKSFLTSVIDDIEKSVTGSGKEGVVMTGLENLDKLIDGMRPEEYIIIGARPGTGKTSIALNMTIAAAKAGKRVGFFSAEMSKGLITKRMLCSIAGINGQKIRSGLLSKTDLDKIMAAASDMYVSKIYINDSPNIPMGVLISEARRMRRKEKIDVLFVDYMSLVTVDSDAPRHEQVAELSRRFKQLARELNIPVVVIVQVNREAQDKRPTMANLRESGCLGGGTFILHQKGLKMISRLDGEEYFMLPSIGSDGGENRMAKKCFCTGIDKLYNIETTTGHTIMATDNHKFLAPYGRWYPLASFEKGDLIGLFISEIEGTDTITLDEARFMALFLGNGCALPRRSLQYTSNSKDEDLCDEMIKIADNIWGDDVSPYKKLQAYRKGTDNESSAINIFFPSRRKVSRKYHNPIVLFLQKMGMYDKRAKEKSLPDIIFGQSLNTRREFLKYLWATDGTISGTNGKVAISYSTSSHVMALGVQILLQGLGILSSISAISKNGHRWYNININSKRFILKFMDDIGIAGSRKGGKIRECRAMVEKKIAGWTRYEMDSKNGVVYVPIKRITSRYESHIYDIEVPVTHNFIANGFIVHNSIEQDADIIMLMWNRGWSDENPQMVKVTMIVEKNRNGATGDVDLMFKPDITRFYSETKTLTDGSR